MSCDKNLRVGNRVFNEVIIKKFNRSLNMRFLIVVLFLGLTLSIPEVEAKKEKLADLMWGVSNGMKQQEVFKLMSEGGWKPYDRSFSGNNEAWLYCKDGMYWTSGSAQKTDGYTIWFQDGVVRSMTTVRGSFCRGIGSIDWGQMPPDLEVDINVNNR